MRLLRSAAAILQARAERIEATKGRACEEEVASGRPEEPPWKTPLPQKERWLPADVDVAEECEEEGSIFSGGGAVLLKSLVEYFRRAG